MSLWAAASAQGPAEGELQVERATPTSLNVIWDDAEGATSYAIRWRLVGTPRFGTEVAASGGKHLLTGLLPGRKYVVQVRARDAEGTLVARLTGTFRTVLTTPVGFGVTDTGAGSLTVSWGKPVGWDPSAYELRWRRPSDAPFLGSVKLAADATNHTLAELDDQTQYVVNLIALNDVGDSSLDVSDTGWAVGPLSMTLSAASEDCVAKLWTDLSWEIAGGLKPYRLWVQGTTINLEAKHSHRVRCGSIPIDPETGEAVANPTKTFGARVLDGLGTEVTAEATVNLVRLSGPALNIGVLGSSSAAFTWMAPDGWAPVPYRLRWRLAGASEVLGQVDINASTRAYTLGKLDASQEYVLRLTAVHGSHLESLPATARVTTLPALTLALISSGESCLANTPTTLTWQIVGGKAPYSLKIEGQSVDSGAATHSVDCGPIPTDPITGEAVENPEKTFTATAEDSVGGSVTAETTVALVPQFESGDGVADIPVPAELQRTIIASELSAARAQRAELLALVGPSGQSDETIELTTAQRRFVLDAIADLEARITRLTAIDLDALSDTDIEDAEYTFVKGRGDGIAFSKFTYEIAGDDTSPVVAMRQKDPTQIVLWGQATRARVKSAFEEHTRFDHTESGTELYRWEPDENAICSVLSDVLSKVGYSGGDQYVAMQNSASASGDWTWARSTGLQPGENWCTARARYHFRYFSSDDSNLDDEEAIDARASLGRDVGGYGDWVVIAAHYELFDLDILDKVRLIVLGIFGSLDIQALLKGGHRVVDWDGAESRVVRSLTTPQYVGPRYNLFTTPPCSLAPPIGFLNWVKSIRYCSFGNATGESGSAPQGVSHDGWGHVIEMDRLPTTAPKALSRPSFTSQPSTNSIEVTAVLPAEANWFDVYYRRKLDNRRRDMQQTYDVIPDNKPGRAVVIDSLVSGARYRIKVRAYSTRAKSMDSAEIDVTAEALAGCGSASSSGVSSSATASTVCLALLPAGPTASNATWSSLTLHWSVSSDATSYEVKHTQLDHCRDDTESVVEISSSATTSHRYQRLKPDTPYTLCIRTVREVFEPDFLTSYEVRSDWMSAAGRTSALPAPTNLKVTNVTGAGATLRWDSSDSAIDDFSVRLDGDDIDPAVGSVRQFSFDSNDGFMASTAHRLGVASVYDRFRSTFTELILLRPPTLDDPTATTSAITVSWKAVRGATGYDAKRVASSGDCEGSPDAQVTTTSHTFAIPESERDVEHRLCIRATNHQGESAWASETEQTEVPSDLMVTIDASAIAGDGTVNIEEKARGFDISGTATAGANVSVTVGETTLPAVKVDEDGDWSVTVPEDSEDVEESSVSVTAEASKKDHENASTDASFKVDLTAAVVSYATPAGLQVETAVTVNPVTTHTDIASYALATGEDLPSGLSLNIDTGVVTGTPDERGEAATTTNITVRDEAGNIGTATLSLPRIEGLEQVLEGFDYTPDTMKWGDDVPTLTAPTGAMGALSYSVGEDSESVCTVDKNSGALNLEGLGDCTITATAAATKTHEQAKAEATVTINAPTLTGRLRAVKRSNGQIEFAFRTTGGDVHLPSPDRFVRPSSMTPGVWEETSSFADEVDELDFTVGQISLRLSCAGYIKVTLLPPEGERISPEMRNFCYKTATVDAWRRSAELTVTLTLSTEEEAEGAAGTAGGKVEAAEAGFTYPVGVEGGFMAEAGATGAAAVSTDPCTPESLEVSDIGRHSMTLSWDPAPGAASYEVKRSQATTPVASSGTTSHEFDGLSASTEYTLSVRAKRGTQTSDWAALTRTTSACGNVPASVRSLPLSESRWIGTGAIQDEQQRTGTQSQTRTVNWSSATCTGTVGDWRNSGQPSWTEWTNTGNKRCNPKVPTKPRTEKTETVTVTLEDWQVRGDTAYERERTDTEHYSRTVTRQSVADGCGWDVGEWGEPDDVDLGAPEDSGTSKRRDDPVPRMVTLSTTFSWVVRGDTAHKQVTLRLRDDERPYVWSGAPDNKWELGNWQEGTPYTKGPEDVDPPETNKRPPTKTWNTEVNTTSTGRTRVIRVQTEPICLEQTQEEYRYRIRSSSQPYVWNGVDDWVLGEETSFTPPVWHYRWQNVGSERLCALGRQGEEADESAAPAAATFGTGQHTLQWGVNWLQFTVPNDTTISLSTSADASGELVAVFGAARGTTLEVSVSALASGERPTSTDPTLAALATSLTLVVQPADVPAGVTAASCAVATLSGSLTGVQVYLDTNSCVQVVGGGVARLVASERTLTVTLPDGHEWIVFLVPATNESAPSGIWLIDLDSGSMLVLDPVTATETARLLDSPGSAVGAVFDAITASASVSEE